MSDEEKNEALEGEQRAPSKPGQHALELDDMPSSDTTTELPAVVLGTNVGEHIDVVERVLPGRVPASAIFYPIYLLLVISGGITANVALDTGEWSFFMIVIAWALAFAWNWLYVVAWEYRRRPLKLFSMFNLLGMELGLAALAMDRAAPQKVATSKLELFDRPAIPKLEWVAGMLLLCVLLFALHFLWFGRGWRSKEVSAPTERTPTVSEEDRESEEDAEDEGMEGAIS